MENNIGRILFDNELAEVLVFPKTRDVDGKLSDLNVDINPSSSSDPKKVQVLKILPTVANPSSSFLNADANTYSSSDLNAAANPSSSSALNNVQANKTTDSWSSLFQKHIDRSRDLQRDSNPSTYPDHHIVFDEEDASAAVQNWGNSLVGYFIGKALPIPGIRSCLSKAWRVKDLELIPMQMGFCYSSSILMMLDNKYWVKDHGSFMGGH